MKKVNKCPLCLSRNYKKESEHRNYVFNRCLVCDCLFLANPLSQKDIKEMYRRNKAVGDNKKTNFMLHVLTKNIIGNKIFDLLKNYIYKSRSDSVDSLVSEKSAKVLDFGCGNGEFLLNMKNLGWNINGVEVSDELRKKTSNLSGARLFSGIKSISGKFDVITLWHVLEHLQTPVSDLKKISTFLKKKGTLVVEVPHSRSVSERVFGGFWTLFLLPQHLHIWSLRTFETVCNSANLKISKVEYPNHFPFVFASSLIKRWYFFMPFLPVILPISFVVSCLSSKLGKGEVIRIYAVKK